MAALLCHYADWIAAVSALGLHPLDQGDCDDHATHLASAQMRREGLIVTIAAHVCVWHAEIVRQGTPGLITLPHTPLTGARP